MNTLELDSTAPLTPKIEDRTILYFRFRFDVGAAIQQVEYDLLQTNLSQHRGYDDSADALCRDGYWAVAATSETGVNADAIDYTANYLRSMPVVARFSVTTMPPVGAPPKWPAAR